MASNLAARQAMKDITDDFKGKAFTVHVTPSGVKEYDNWFVNGKYLYNKEQRELNRALGIHNVNYFGKRKDKPVDGWEVFSNSIRNAFKERNK